MNTPITELPDGSGCFTATIMSTEEAMALPLKDRPLNHRISSEIYHAVFEAIGAASMCWNPRPSDEVFSSEEASKVAVDLCFKFADEIEKQRAELEAEWTNAAEALPPYMTSVLVWCPESQNTYCAYYYFYAGSSDPNKVPIWAFYDHYSPILQVTEKVTHWRSMPTPLSQK